MLSYLYNTVTYSEQFLNIVLYKLYYFNIGNNNSFLYLSQSMNKRIKTAGHTQLRKTNPNANKVINKLFYNNEKLAVQHLFINKLYARFIEKHSG